MNITNALKWFLAIILSGALLFAYVFYSVSTGQAFAAFQAWCASSQSLTAVVGEFRTAKLSPMGTFFEKDKGTTGVAGFTANIVGSARAVNADVSMARTGDVWKVSRVMISGKILEAR